MFFIKKKTKEELAELPLDKDAIKGGNALVKGVRKFLRYNDDLISDERKELIAEKRGDFVEALQNPELKRKEVEALAEDLTETCKKSVKDYEASAWKENIEVIFVAVVIAMGIRAYFIQQFKIPTGSMQPTLNGIVAYPTPDMNPKSRYHAPADYKLPSLPKRAWDKFWYGRSHVEWIAKEDDHIVLNSSNVYGKTHFIFFPRTYLITKKGHKYSAPGTDSRIQMLLNQQLIDSSFSRIIPVKKGDVIARGWVDTGDQLVVNKFIYHWKKPNRGDVFVFNTRDIRGIQAGLDPRQGSQHYIKRLAGTPGDEIAIDPPNLMINGEIAEEPGFKRVASQEGLYTGYTRDGSRLSVELKDKEYWALGDNSANSSDSRMWGAVPEHRIVGRGAFVYYPFGHHFGKIR
ncbi:signal peptidase I [Verrucomicrobiales bacterium]|nr:signal peptidase I [Verrucomicrobiales bacterium]